MNHLRFFKMKHIIPNQNGIASLLSNRTLWETMPIWEGSTAPGGSLYVFNSRNLIRRGWRFHRVVRRIYQVWRGDGLRSMRNWVRFLRSLFWYSRARLLISWSVSWVISLSFWGRSLLIFVIVPFLTDCERRGRTEEDCVSDDEPLIYFTCWFSVTFQNDGERRTGCDWECDGIRG